MRRLTADVAIVGGGIIGCATALFLQRKGKRCVVLERGMVGAEASGRNGGGVRQQGRLAPEIPFARGALALWPRLEGLLGRPTGFRQIGNMFVAETEAEMALLTEEQQREQVLGLQTELLDAEQVRELSPGLAPGRFVGGKLSPEDGSADPALTTVAIAEAAREAGAEMLCHERVERIGLVGDAVAYVETADVRVEAPLALDAAGPWSPSVAQLVDVYLPVYPCRLHQLRTAPMEYLAGPFTMVAHWDFHACQLADGRVQFGEGDGQPDPHRFTYSKRPDPRRFEGLLRRAAEVFPALATATLEPGWVGIMEYTPDMMPILGPVDEPGPRGFWVATGFSGHGFCLGPYAGQLMAEWIADGRPSLDLGAFRHGRFTGLSL